ncbi:MULTISPECIES: SDR family oxidoreductase [unclassified Devosia]|uniref:SDR family oxidoreductase n=1 Tax=unclassified Devosia TaxID=196773 RepID=UPI001551FD9B|nr:MULTISPECIES: SDR family oxidoreductase [unclassified Devosia]
MSDDQINPPQHQDHQPGRETEMSPAPDFAPKFPGNGRLAGKVAIITGGDSGIGRACAVLFAREGAEVAIVYLEETEDAKITAEAIKAEGKNVLLLRGDVGEKAFCDNVVGKVIEEFGKIDVLVNNAAEQHPQDEITDISEEQLEKTFRTNIFGYFFMTQAAMPHLQSGASIVNTTSVTAYRGSPELLDYSSTKGAILAFTRSLSGSLAEKGIRVNAVAPGPIWTPLIPATFPEDKVAEFGASQPMKRPGQPNEVATCHLFLACDESSYISGQVLHPNGGEIVGG